MEITIKLNFGCSQALTGSIHIINFVNNVMCPAHGDPLYDEQKPGHMALLTILTINDMHTIQVRA